MGFRPGVAGFAGGASSLSGTGRFPDSIGLWTNGVCGGNMTARGAG